MPLRSPRERLKAAEVAGKPLTAPIGKGAKPGTRWPRGACAPNGQARRFRSRVLHAVDALEHLGPLRAASDRISNAIADLPIFPHHSFAMETLYGSVDGQKFGVARPTDLEGIVADPLPFLWKTRFAPACNNGPIPK
jgi:hypothetical protein